MLPTLELLDLKETFLVQEDLYNIAELKSGIISEKKYLEITNQGNLLCYQNIFKKEVDIFKISSK